MMKIKLALLALILFITKAHAQPKIDTPTCGFLKNLQFKNGVDTINIIAYKIANIRWVESDPIIKKLYALRKANKHYLFSIVIKPEDCNMQYPVYCIDKRKFADTVQYETYKKPVKMRCVVYQNFKHRAHPLFIIDKIDP